MSYPELKLLIDGEWLDGRGREAETVVDPATGGALGELPHANVGDLDRALAAAHRAFGLWRRTSAYDRARILIQAAVIVRQRAEAIAELITREQGKLLADSRGEVNSTADILDWSAAEGRRAYGRIIPARAPHARQMVLREPVGPVAAFAPWNAPALLSTRKIAEALAAGCSIVIKPAEEAPASVLEIAKAFQEAGLPPGVLNVVFGVPSDVSKHLIASPLIRKISFTGSVAVGKSLAVMAAQGGKRIALELGGHAPVLVFDDVDVESVVRASVIGKYRNAGQLCVTPSRFLVQEGIYERFVSGFAQASRALTVGNGLDPSAAMGPLAHARRVTAMERLTQNARHEGARLEAGGERIGNAGFFWQPTVFADVPREAALMTEEPFGPISAILPFRTLPDAIEEANRLEVGLASYAFTRSARTMRDVAEGLESGLTGINTYAVNAPETPFGGVKETGNGSEGGSEGVAAYLTTRYVHELTV